MPDTLIGNLQVDPPIQLTATFRYDIPDRRYLDRQILGAQQHLVDSLLSQAVCSWYLVDVGSASLVVGDIVCLAGGATNKLVTKATPSALANGGKALGIVMNPANPGVNVRVALWGTVGTSVTGLVGSANRLVRVSSAARCELVATYTPGDYPIGVTDVAGNLAIDGLPVFGFGSFAPGSAGQVLTSIAGPALLWQTPAGDWLGPINANTVVGLTGTAGVVAIHGTTLRWDAGVVGPSITQVASAAAGQAMKVQAQGSTGNSVAAGPLNLFGGTSTAVDTGTGGDVNVTAGSALGGNGFGGNVSISAGIGSGNGDGSIFLSTGASGGFVSYTIGGTQRFQFDASALTLSVVNLTFAANQASPVIKQANVATAAATGQPLLVQAQNSTGTGATVGAALDLRTGTGNTPGAFTVRIGATTRIGIASTGILTFSVYGAGILHSSSGGVVSSSPVVVGDITPGSSGQVMVTNVTPAAVWVTAGPDWTGAVDANAVVQLTGSAGTVSILAATKLAWASSGPSLENASGDQVFRLNGNNSFKFYETTNNIGILYWNSGNPYFQVGAGATAFQFLANAGTSQSFRVLVAGTTPVGIQLDANDIYFRSGASANKGRWNASGLRIGDGNAAAQALEVVGRAVVSDSVTANNGGTAAVLRDFTGSASYAALYMGVTAGAGNYSLISNGSEIILNAPVGGIGFRQAGAASGVWTSVGLRVGDATSPTDQLELLGNNFSWDKAASAPKIYQKNNTTNSATGAVLTVQAQTCTGTTSVGADISLISGDGTSAAGSIKLTGGTNLIGVFNWNAANPYFQVGSGASVFQFLANAGTSQAIRIGVAGTTPVGIQFDADNIYFRTGASANKGLWNNSGLRVGDGTAATDKLEVVGNIKIDRTVSSPQIYQAQASSGSGQTLLLAAQSSASSGVVNGGALQLASGAANGGGVVGPIRLQPGGTTAAILVATGLRIGDGTTPTHILEIAGSEIFHEGSFFSIKGSVSAPVWQHLDPASGNNGADWSVIAQAGIGTNKTGGNLIVAGGPGTGTGVPGGFVAKIGGTTGDQMLQVVSLSASAGASTGGVVALCRKAVVTTTQVPNGDGLVFVGDITTGATSNPVSGTLFWSEAGKVAWRTAAGNIVRWDSISRGTAAAGAGGAVPATVDEFLEIIFNGNTRRIPLFH